MKEKIENIKNLMAELKDDIHFEEENEEVDELISIIDDKLDELEFILEK